MLEVLPRNHLYKHECGPIRHKPLTYNYPSDFQVVTVCGIAVGELCTGWMDGLEFNSEVAHPFCQPPVENTFNRFLKSGLQKIQSAVFK